ncbi:MAG: HYR domain-containing protein [Bacteroidia bacterium]|nr:HYR domain-containing protein [Bacteroidia bacterium]
MRKLLIFILAVVPFLAWAQNLNFTNTLTQIISYENAGISGPCWETGDEEYTRNVWFGNNLVGANDQIVSCDKCTNNGNCTSNWNITRTGSNTFVTSLQVRGRSWEDDDADCRDRCQYDGSSTCCGFLCTTIVSGDDCFHDNTFNMPLFNYNVGTTVNWYLTQGTTTTVFGIPVSVDQDHEYRGHFSYNYTNDACATATSISMGGTATGFTNRATIEGYGGCGSSIANSGAVWHKIVGNGSQYVASTAGSDFDTYLRIFEGSCGNLSCVASNDDGGPGTTSLASWNAACGVTYYIMVSGYSSYEGTYQLAISQGTLTNPATPFGIGSWNVYTYAGRNLDVSVLPYQGKYTEGNLSFDSRNRWCNTCSPAQASGYQGCDPGVDNHSVVYKRQGFPCGRYQLNIPSHDDEVVVYIDGIQVFTHNPGCCDAHANIWTGYLTSSTTIEYRWAEGGGGSHGALEFVPISTSAPGDPCYCPAWTWNAYAFDGTDLNLTSATYVGYYVHGDELSWDSRDRWCNTCSPANVTSPFPYQGTDPGVDTHTMVYKRCGFPCGDYQLSIPSHDDDVRVYLDGVQIFEHIGCCDAHNNFTTVHLDGNSSIEYRWAEGVGGSHGSLSFNRLSDPPVISNCPSNQTLPAGANCTISATWTEPNYADACEGADVAGFVYIGQYGENHYYRSTTSLTWNDARTFCVANGGDLVSIGSAGENAFVTSGITGSTWIGYNDIVTEGNWVWSNGDISTYTNWNAGEPNNSGNEDGGEILTSGLWNDNKTTAIRPFVMEIGIHQTCGIVNGGNFPLGFTPICYKATNVNGETTFCNFNITVTDQAPPNIACPAAITVSTGTSCGANVTYSAPVISDNCSTPSITLLSGIASGGFFPKGTTTNTYKATDGAGNTAQCSFDVTVVDQTLPAISCPANITVAGNQGSNPCSATVTYTPPVGTDNCPGATTQIFSGSPSGSLFQIGTTTVGYRVQDAAGNQASCSFTVTVTSCNAPPVAVCKNVTVNANGSCQGTAAATQFNNGSSDPDGDPLTFSVSPAAPYSLGTTNVVLTVSDGTLSSTCNASVTVVDNTNPTITCPANISVNAASGLCAATVTYSTPTFTDNCSGATVARITGPASGSSLAVGTYSTTWRATDGNGNTANCTFQITVVDNQNPSITCPANQSISATSAAGAAATYTTPVGTDNCSGPSTSQTAGLASGATFPIGTTTNTFTVTDGAGHTASCSFTIQVSGVAPSIVCPANITVNNAAGQCGNTVTFAATDNAGIPASTITYSQNPGTNFNVGTTNVFATATNAVGSSNCSFTVTVVDNEAPVVNCPSTLTLCADAFCQATLPDFAFPGYTKLANSAQDFNGAQGFRNWQYAKASYSNGSLFNWQQLPNFTGFVHNNPGSTLAFPQLDANGGHPDLDNLLHAVRRWTSSYNGTVNLNLQFKDRDGNCGDGAHVRVFKNNVEIWQYFNIPTTTQNFTIPVTVACGDVLDFSIDPKFDGGCDDTEFIINIEAVNGASASDNCGVTSISQSPSPLAGIPTGSTAVTLTASDASGNNGSCTFNVVVIDNQAPVLSGVPADVTVECDAVPAPASVTATDNCSAVVTFSEISSQGPVSNVYYAMNEGSGTSISDELGNGPNGFLTSGVTWTTGFSGTALQLPGTGNFYAEIPNGTGGPLDAPNSVSMFARFIPGTNGSAQMPIIQYGPNGWGCHLWQVGPNTLFVRFTVRNSLAFTTGLAANVLVPGEWNCVGATYDQSTGLATLWHNGNIVSQLNIGIIPLATNLPVRIGSVNFDGRRTNGVVDDVRIWDRALTPQEVATLCACPQEYTISRTWTATDPSGNTASATQIIHVEDNTPPVVSCPANLSISAPTGQCSAVATYSATATDNCASNVDLTYSQASGSSFPLGSTTVTVTAEDECSNASTCSFTVTVTDNENPTITCPSSQSLIATSAAGAVATWTNPVGADNCPGASTSQTAGLASGSTFPIGITTNTFTVTDGSGNTSSCFFTIEVVGVAPAIVCPANLTVNTDPGQCSAAGTFAANDPAGIPPSTITYSSNPGSVFSLGNTTVTATATNAVGTSSCSFTITVEDHEAPAAICQNVTVQLDAGGNGSTSANAVDNGSNDACGIASYSLSATSFNCGNVGTNAVVLTVTDNNGNVSTCSANVIVQDNIAPVAICQDVTVQLDNNGNGSTTAGAVNNGSTDACGIATLALGAGQGSFDCSNIGPNTVTQTVTDVNGNSSNCTATVTVVDQIPPLALCQDITVSLDATGNVSIAGGQVDGGSTDNCTIQFITVSPPNTFDCNNIGANVVTLAVVDVNNNYSICTANVTIEDNTPPVAICKDITVQLSSGGTVSIAGQDVDNSSTDACGIQSYAVSPSSFECSDQGSNPVTLTVTDVNGNSSTCNANVRVEDNVDPVAICQDVTVQLDANGSASTTAQAVDNGSNDACGIVSLSLDVTSFDCSDLGANTVTLTVTDGSTTGGGGGGGGQQLDQSQTTTTTRKATLWQSFTAGVTGQLTQIDLIMHASSTTNTKNLNIYAGAGTGGTQLSGPQTLTFSTNSVFESFTLSTPIPVVAGQVYTISLVGFTSTRISYAAGTNPYAGGEMDVVGGLDDLAFRTYVTTAGGSNGNSPNTSTCTATVTVQDNIPPTISCPPTQNLIATSAAGATATFTNPVGTDNCPATTAQTAGLPSGSTFPIGSTTNTFTVTDASGNTASCSFDINVVGVPPAIVCPADITVNTTAGQCDGVATYTATDPVGIPASTITYTINPGSTFPLGSTSVTATATNSVGSSSCTFNVTVEDHEAPVALCQDVTVQLDASGNGSTTAVAVDNGSSDACGIQSLVLSATSFNCGNVGANPVTLTVTDNNGNVSTCSANVQVEDNVAPVALCQDVTVQLDASGNGSTTAVAVDNGSNDACGIASLSLSQTGFNCGNVGSNPVTLTVTDNNGNISTCSANVQVEDNVAPVALCQDVTVQLDASGNGSTTAVAVDNGSNDACGIASLSLSQTGFNCGNVGSNPVTLTVTDNNGNISTCSANVQVEDNVAPVALCQDVTVQLDASGNGSTTAVAVDNGSNDACGIASLSLSQTSFNCGNVGANPVTLTVTDVNGNVSTCSASVEVEDNVPPIALCQDITINTDSTGFVAITPQQIDNGSSDNCTVASLAVNPNTFDCNDKGQNPVVLTVTDVNGNVSTCNATVTVTNDALVCSTSSPTFACGYNISCNGQTDGQATVSVTGGCLPYTYLWTDGQLTSTAINLAAGTYSVTVTDGVGDQTTCTITLTEPAQLVDGFSIPTFACGYNVSCNGASDGSIDYSLSGGCQPYTYSWTGPNGYTFSGQDPQNITAGTYNVTATDQNGCFVTNSFTLTEPALLNGSSVIPTYACGYNISCNGNSDGSIDYSMTGGCQPYSYSWSGPNGFTATSQDISNLVAGTYNVTTTDANGCSLTESFTLTQPAVMQITSLVPSVFAGGYNIGCNGGANGKITVNIAGGASCQAYTVTLSGPVSGTQTGGTPRIFTGLTAGTYTVTVTDANGCTDVSTITLTQAPPLSVDAGVDRLVILNTPFLCPTITAIPTGGVAPYSYYWFRLPSPLPFLNGQTMIDCPTTTTTYVVRIKDANSCVAFDTVVVNVIQRNAVGNPDCDTLGYKFCFYESCTDTCIRTGNLIDTLASYTILGNCLGDCDNCGPCANQGSKVAMPEEDGQGNSAASAEFLTNEPTFEAFPNPFEEKTTLRFTLPKADQVTVLVFDLRGELVATLFNGQVEANERMEVTFRPENVTEGVYVSKLVTGSGAVFYRKLILVR